MAVGGIEAHANNLDVVLLELVHAVAETASFFSAARRVIFGIEIEQNNFFADLISELPIFAILILAFDQGGLIADFWSFSGLRGKGEGGKDERCQQRNGTNGMNFHSTRSFERLYSMISHNPSK